MRFAINPLAAVQFRVSTLPRDFIFTGAAALRTQIAPVTPPATPRTAQSPVYSPPYRAPVVTSPYTPPRPTSPVRTPAITSPVPTRQAPLVTRAATVTQRVEFVIQRSSAAVAKHAVERALNIYRSQISGKVLTPSVYDGVKKNATSYLKNQRIPFVYRSGGVMYRVEGTSVRNGAASRTGSALQRLGYSKGTAARVASPVVTPRVTSPAVTPGYYGQTITIPPREQQTITIPPRRIMTSVAPRTPPPRIMTSVAPRTPPTRTPAATVTQRVQTVLQRSPSSLALHAAERALNIYRSQISGKVLTPSVYDGVKKNARTYLENQRIPFVYPSGGVMYRVDRSSIRNTAATMMGAALYKLGYTKGASVTIPPIQLRIQPIRSTDLTVYLQTPTHTPSRTQVLTSPIIRPYSPIIATTPAYRPVYSPGIATTPAYRPVYSPRIETTPVYRPVFSPIVATVPAYTPVYSPVSPRPIPTVTPPVWTRAPVATPTVVRDTVVTQTSYRRLARHALELSLSANARGLAQEGVSNPLIQPSPRKGLSSALISNITRYAINMIKRNAVPFGYETVRGERFVVKSSGLIPSAIKYMPNVLAVWGYFVEVAKRVIPVETGVYTLPRIMTAVPLITPPRREIPLPTFPITAEKPVALDEPPTAFIREPIYDDGLIPPFPIAFEPPGPPGPGPVAYVGEEPPITFEPPGPPGPGPVIFVPEEPYDWLAITFDPPGGTPGPVVYEEPPFFDDWLEPLPPFPIIHEPDPALDEPPTAFIPEPLFHEPPVLLDEPPTAFVREEPSRISESSAIQWAVSYMLTEFGLPQYALSSAERTGVPQEVFDKMVYRAGYIAEQMIFQNTYSPSL